MLNKVAALPETRLFLFRPAGWAGWACSTRSTLLALRPATPFPLSPIPTTAFSSTQPKKQIPSNPNRPIARWLYMLITAFLLSPALSAGDVWKGEFDETDALIKNAKAGEPEAMASVAFLSRYSKEGVRYDQALIYDYSRRSAEAGNAFGMSGLSFCYMNGCGIRRDPDMAFQWSKKSSDLGHPNGINRLAICYNLGKGTGKDPVKWAKLANKSAATGCINGKFTYAMVLLEGPEEQRDAPEAFRILYQLATKHQWSPAAWRASKEIKRQNINDPEAWRCIIEILENNAAKDDPYALFRIAHLQKDKLGHDIFLNRIIRACRLGHPYSLINLASYITNYVEKEYDFPIHGTERVKCNLKRAAWENGYRSPACTHNFNIVQACVFPESHFARDLPTALSISQEWILKGHEHYHPMVSAAYMYGTKRKIKGFEKPKLSIAHAIYTYKSGNDDERLKDDEYQLFRLMAAHDDGMAGDGSDPVKAALCAEILNEMGCSYLNQKDLKRLRRNLSDKQRVEMADFRKRNYPAAEEFQKQARKEILASGFKLP